MEVLNVTDTIYIYIYLHRRQNRRASSSEIYSSFDEITESAYISVASQAKNNGVIFSICPRRKHLTYIWSELPYLVSC